ncbi:hypothetical protein ACT4UT_38325, partial [Bacillus sp. B-TM1]
WQESINQIISCIKGGKIENIAVVEGKTPDNEDLPPQKPKVKTNVEKHQNETFVGLNKEKKDELIHQKVDEVLREVPVEYRDVKREEVMSQVTNEVKKQEESVKKEVLAFSNDVNHYAKNQMAMSFTDLYSTGTSLN